MEPGTDGAGEAVVQAALPAQPSAGKVEYHLELTTPAGPVRIPADGEEEIVLRFKDPVPGYFLWPHVAARRSALLAAGLGGSTWTIPRRRALANFEAEEVLDPTAALEPGQSAVIIVADHDTAAELTNDLIRSGGDLV